MTSLMKLGYSKVLTMDDLWSLKKSDSAQYNSDHFQRFLQAELDKKNPSLLSACFYSFWKTLITSALFKLIQDILQFTQPQLLKEIMNFAKTYAPGAANQPFRYGFFIAFLMFVTAIIQTLFLHQYFQACFILGMRVRSSIITAIYMKALRLSNSSRQGIFKVLDFD
jgi:ATP-binding cassette subfamily C (CFTR/MRP) protein 1